MAAQVGLDVGSASIKVIQVNKNGGKYLVEALGVGANPVGNTTTENPQERKLIAEAIRKTVMDAGIKLRQVRTALSESEVYSRVIEVPPLTEAELSSALGWEAEQYIPVPLKDVNLDWQILGKSGDVNKTEKMLVLLVAAPKAVVAKMTELIQSAGLDPVVLETNILALSRAVVPVAEVNPILICNLGANGAEIGVVERGRLMFVYAAATGGIALTRSLSQGLKLEFVQAEQYKRAYGMDERQLEGKIKEVLIPAMGVVVNELKKAIHFYVSRNQTTGIKQLILAGGGAQLSGLGTYLANQLNMEVMVSNPLAGWDWNPAIKQRFEGIESVFAVAVGLAIGGV